MSATIIILAARRERERMEREKKEAEEFEKEQIKKGLKKVDHIEKVYTHTYTKKGSGVRSIIFLSLGIICLISMFYFNNAISLLLFIGFFVFIIIAGLQSSPVNIEVTKDSTPKEIEGLKHSRSEYKYNQWTTWEKDEEIKKEKKSKKK
jgi:hypothetical protein